MRREENRGRERNRLRVLYNALSAPRKLSQMGKSIFSGANERVNPALIQREFKGAILFRIRDLHISL